MEEEKEQKGIKIGDKYIIKPDTYCLILEEYGYKNPSPKDAKKARDEGITLEPKWGLVRTTYHRTLKQVLNSILDGEVLDKIQENIKDIKEVVAVIESLRSDFDKFENCTKLNEDTLSVIK